MNMTPINLVKQLTAQSITKENFQSYGQVIYPASDDRFYDLNDAQLILDRGIPRFYIMRLYYRGRRFHQITRHVQCTQCLGSLAGKEWLIAVALASSSKPVINEVVAFRIPGSCFIKLDVGTWHAGPYFDNDMVDFYSLELSDTNINDHDTYNFWEDNCWEWEII